LKKEEVGRASGGGVDLSTSSSFTFFLEINQELTDAPFVEVADGRQQPGELGRDMADAWKVKKEREGEKVRWGSAIVDDGGKKTEEDEFSILNRRTLDEVFEVEDRGVRHGLRGEGESVWRKRKRRRSRAMFFSLSLCFSSLFLFSKKKKSGEEKTNGFTL